MACNSFKNLHTTFYTVLISINTTHLLSQRLCPNFSLFKKFGLELKLYLTAEVFLIVLFFHRARLVINRERRAFLFHATQFGMDFQGFLHRLKSTFSISDIPKAEPREHCLPCRCRGHRQGSRH